MMAREAWCLFLALAGLALVIVWARHQFAMSTPVRVRPTAWALHVVEARR